MEFPATLSQSPAKFSQLITYILSASQESRNKIYDHFVYQTTCLMFIFHVPKGTAQKNSAEKYWLKRADDKFLKRARLAASGVYFSNFLAVLGAIR